MSARRARTGAEVVTLLLGASGCAATSPVPERVATAGLTPAAPGGLQRACMSDEMLLVLAPLVVVAAPFLLVYAVVGTPVRVLARRRR